jgi:hypothetical protein
MEKITKVPIIKKLILNLTMVVSILRVRVGVKSTDLTTQLNNSDIVLSDLYQRSTDFSIKMNTASLWKIYQTPIHYL